MLALARIVGGSGGGGIPFGSPLWFTNAGISCAPAGSCVHQATILPVVKKKHQLLVTLLLCNAATMEVIPQAICTRYGLAVGAKSVRLVRILMIICYPVAYPIGKTTEEAMTPIESTFSLDVNSKLDWEAFSKILTRGHCRIPVYSGNPRNIIGFLLLVKSLLTVRAETETPVSAVSIRRIPRVPAYMPLYDILNEFQKGRSHMAAVVKTKVKTWSLAPTEENKFDENKEASDESNLITPLLSKVDATFVVDIDKGPEKQANGNNPTLGLTSEDIEDGEAIGIINLEDVFEELLQNEIVDETDEYVDVHKRIRVATVVAASSVARAHQLGG